MVLTEPLYVGMTAEKNENKTFISVPISTLILGAKKKLCVLILGKNYKQKSMLIGRGRGGEGEGKGRGRGGGRRGVGEGEREGKGRGRRGRGKIFQLHVRNVFTILNYMHHMLQWA